LRTSNEVEIHNANGFYRIWQFYAMLSFCRCLVDAFAYKSPNNEQKIAFSKLFGCVRHLYNWGVNAKAGTL
jgi:hypothetical protein